jgi:hypothetical protein
VGDEGECPGDTATRDHSACYQRSRYRPASERSSLKEKAIDCGELKDDRRRSDKVLANLRSVYEKFGLIQDYADNWGKLSNLQSLSFIRQWLDADIATAQLRQKYVPIVNKVLDGKKTATFFQLDRRIAMMLELQVSSQMPLVQEQ